MIIQIVNFHLKGISEADYRKLCDELTPAFLGVPGLLSKVWLANAATNTYGGVMTWENQEAMENFAKSELFRAVVTHPNLAGITATDFGVLEGPTRATRGYTVAHA